ncbi:MAG TPA: transglycosylase domain-containing protein [Jatrophihabitans sp.]
MSSFRRDGSTRSGKHKSGVAVAKLLACVVVAGTVAAGFAVPYVGALGLAAKSAATDFLNTSCDVTVAPPQQTTRILASDGKTLIATLFDENRQSVALNQIPTAVQRALVDTEDRRFYSNNGVDLRGIARAAVNNGAGGATQGGSTLTMQYVKQLRYFQATTDAQRQAAVQQDLHRKLEDARCALEVEKSYSKAQILDGYFNISFFGENSYGIQTAAETYFGVPASKLTVPQGALLVGLLRSPTQFDPFADVQAAKSRRDQVLANMVSNGDLSAAEEAKYQSTPVTLATSSPPPVKEGCDNANKAVANVGFFCDYVVNWLETQGGVSQAEIQTGGLNIVTTLDASLQNSGQNAIWRGGLDAKSPTALVMPSVDPRTGAVQTMITSRHYGLNTRAGQTTVPLFTTGYAGAGSTYKYFTALAALKLGVQPSFTLTTGSTSYTVRNCPTNAYTTPYTTHNAGTYNATLALKDALPESVNTYFVGMEDQLFGCDLSPVVNTALSMGMTGLNQPQSAGSNVSIAQATIQQHQAGFTLGFSPTSALQLTGAYGTVANDGVYCPPTPVNSITGPDGKAVAFKRTACTRELDPQVARTMVNMMTVDTTSYQGTAASYFSNWYANGGSPIASKTGTDNDDPSGPDGGNGNSALWFVGVTPTLVSASALVNPTSPKSTVAGLPSTVSNNGGDVFGAYASTYWLEAYGPALQAQHWSWPDPAAIPGATNVPDLTGESVPTATSELAAAGFKITVASVSCGSPEPVTTIAYYAAHAATPGSTITVCLSSGVSPNGYGFSQPGQGFSSSSPNQPSTPTPPSQSTAAATPSKPRTRPSPPRSSRSGR